MRNSPSKELTTAFIILISTSYSNPQVIQSEAAPATRPNEPSSRVLKATGRGKAPVSDLSPAQKKLMARRAAMVEAYKGIAKSIGDVESHVAGGTGYEMVDGFIKGVEVVETRYYENGDVEVDVELVVGTSGSVPRKTEKREIVRGDGGRTVETEKGGRTVTAEEWKSIFKSKT